MIDDRLKVTDEVYVFRSQRCIDRDCDSRLNDGSDDEVGEGDTFTDEKCAAFEMGFKSVKGTSLALKECGVGLKDTFLSNDAFKKKLHHIQVCCRGLCLE